MAKKRAPNLIDQLQQHIRESGLSLNQIGRLAGLESEQLSRFMTGKRGLSLPSLARLCEALNLRLVRAGKPRKATAAKEEE